MAARQSPGPERWEEGGGLHCYDIIVGTDSMTLAFLPRRQEKSSESP